MPEFTTATALPAESVVAEVESSATPPRSVDNEKVTVCPDTAALELSVTLKVTSDCSDKPVPPPDPFRATVPGAALKKSFYWGINSGAAGEHIYRDAVLISIAIAIGE